MPPAAASTLATTERVRYRVHGGAADVRPSAFMPHSAGLAPTQVLVLGIANLSDRRTTLRPDLPHFTGG